MERVLTMEVRNHMEYVVNHMLDSVLKLHPDVCKCERCVSDIKAIALNSLPPKYVATEKGEVFTKANELTIQFEADVIRALVEAIGKVKGKPNH